MPTTRQQLKSATLSRPKPKTGTAVLASSRNYSASTIDATTRAAMRAGVGWQSTIWNFFDIVPEFHYSVTWVGNILSKAKLTLVKDGKVLLPDPTTGQYAPEDQAAADALNNLFGGPSGQSEMFRQLGLHFTTTGEGYLMGFTDQMGDDDWMIAPACDLTESMPGHWKLHEQEFVDPLVIRLWRAHPRFPLRSDCPARAAMSTLAEMDGITKHTAATIDSRLASAGLLLLPSEIDFGAAPTSTTTGEGEEEATSTDQTDAASLVQLLTEVAATAIGDRASAAALVPIIMQVAGEYVDKIKLVEFWSQFDKNALGMRQDASRRLALGMDMPPEILEGTSDMNHWSSWQVEEAAIKAHTEPLLSIIISSLTTGFLRPYLTEGDLDIPGLIEEEADRYSFGYDDQAMRLRPNRSKEALELYDRGELKAATMLRENGFEVTDAIDSGELAHWLVKKVASGSSTPDMVNAALKVLEANLGIDHPTSVRETITDSLDKPNDQKGVTPEVVSPGDPRQKTDTPAPTVSGHPTRQPPTTQDNAPAAAAALMIADRAFERVGNRLRGKMGRKVENVSAADTYMHVTIAPDELDYLLEDSWDACARLSFFGVKPEDVIPKLDAYARMVLKDKLEHSPALFAEHVVL